MARATEIIQNWPDESPETTRTVIDEYREPDELSDQDLQQAVEASSSGQRA